MLKKYKIWFSCQTGWRRWQCQIKGGKRQREDPQTRGDDDDHDGDDGDDGDDDDDSDHDDYVDHDGDDDHYDHHDYIKVQL